MFVSLARVNKSYFVQSIKYNIIELVVGALLWAGRHHSRDLLTEHTKDGMWRKYVS